MSLQLKLKAFRCYSDEELPYTLTFDVGEIVHIKGRSGLGKTTLFEAIQWVLYNYPTTNIYPRQGSASKNTSVTLSIPWKEGQLVIRRQKNPSLLTVVFPDDHQEEDQAAQASLEALFGSRDIWRVCCYLPQNENCPLLGFSNTQRMEILEALSFLQGKPDEDLERITLEIKRLQDELKSAEQDLASLERELNAQNLPRDPEELLLSPEAKEVAERYLREVKSCLEETQTQIIQLEERKKQHERIEERIRKNEQSLSKLPPLDPDEAYCLEEDIKTIQEELPFSRQVDQREKLKNRYVELVDKLQRLPVPERDYTPEEVQEAYRIERKIVEEEQVIKKWKLPSNGEERIQERIAEIKSLLESQKEIQVWSRIKALRDRIEGMSQLEVTMEELERARDEVKALERSIDVLKCPSCQRSLRYLRSSLVLSETSPIPADKIKNLRQALVQMEAVFRENQEKHKLELQLDSLLSTVSEEPSGKILTAAEIKKYEQELADLGKLSFPARPPISSQSMKQGQEYKAFQKQQEELLLEISQYPPPEQEVRSSSFLLEQLNSSQKRLAYLRDLKSKRDTLESQIQIWREELGSSILEDISLLKEEQKRLEIERVELEQAIEMHRQARVLLELEQRCEDKDKALQSLTKELGAALRLKDLAQKEVCAILEEKISAINLVIAEMCRKIFPDPIVVELSMLKTTKTSKVTKPCVHLKIWYKEGEYDSLSQLSGGEGKRISIAVSLALAQLSNFPIILLDECLNGLDEELKELTLQAIREIAIGKTVLVIGHDMVSGYYDSVLDISSVLQG